jgi:hypothetical protein
MRRSQTLAAALAAVLAAVLVACNQDTVWVPRLHGEYLEPTSPDNLVANLAEAYTWQETDGYTPILAPEFVFRFQPGDAQDLGLTSWTRGEDSTATAGLFAAPEVGDDIRISLPHGPAEDAGAPFAPGVQRIRIDSTELEVDIIGGGNAGTTYRIDGDIQDLFFRRGTAAAGEDTTRWFLIEWRDLPAPFAAAGPVTDLAAIETVSWGRIKALYSGLLDAPLRNHITPLQGGVP